VPAGISAPQFAEWLHLVTPSWRWDWLYLQHIRQALEGITRGDTRRLMLLLPPRHGKSEMTTIRYPVWRLERDQQVRVCVGCYNQTFAERFGRKARRIATRRLQLSTERSAAREWETTAGGVFRSCGVGNPPTGEGFDLLIIDDPVKSREEAESEAYRERVWEWYTDDLYTRREPGCAIILIQTRWHEDDLAGRILASEQAGAWEKVSLPALATEDDPLGREPGEALCPERYPVEELQDIRRTQGGYAFEALYQQNPTPREGSFFKVGKLEIILARPAGLRLCRAWDLAGTEGDGDYTAGTLLGRDTDGYTYVCDVVRDQWGPDDVERNVKQTAGLDTAQVSVRLPQDPGQAGKKQAAQLVRLLAGVPVKAEPVSGDKATRAFSFAAQVNSGNVRLVAGEWNRAFIEELRQFPMGKYDDQVDAASDAFNALVGRREAKVW
jgi:predicted phage terminase large subunit-like protein